MRPETISSKQDRINVQSLHQLDADKTSDPDSEILSQMDRILRRLDQIES